MKSKLVKFGVGIMSAGAATAFAADAAVPDVVTGLSVFSLTHAAITTVAIGVIVTWMGFSFLKRIR